MNYIQQIQSR